LSSVEIVEERELHRALELEGALAGEEHHAAWVSTRLTARSAMGRRVGEQCEDRFLGGVSRKHG
jgi:hypothetical protein